MSKFVKKININNSCFWIIILKYCQLQQISFSHTQNEKEGYDIGTMGTGEGGWGGFIPDYSYFFIVMKEKPNKFGCSQVSGEGVRRIAEWHGVCAYEFNLTQYNPRGLTKPKYK